MSSARSSSNHHQPNKRKPFQSLTNTTPQQRVVIGAPLTKPSIVNETDVDDAKVAADDAEAATTTETWNTAKRELGAMFQSQARDKLIRLKKDHPQPKPKHLNATLFPHQEDGLRWLIHQETNGEVPPFFYRWRERWRCKITHKSFPEEPKPVRGGILADGT